MNKVYILGGLRTPIGITNGNFKNVLPEKLVGKLIKEAISRYKLNKIDEVILGNAVGPGGNISRLCVLEAGINVPAFTIDMQCASALMAMSVAYSKIASGMCDLVIAGGVESTSMEPRRLYSKNHPRYSENNESYKVAQFSPNDYDELTMVKGAERVAKKHNIIIEELNYWSKESHSRALETKKKELLYEVIVETYDVKEDEGIRTNINDRLLSRLKPIIKEGGIMNSGNTSLTHDGAGVLVICSEKYLKENNLKANYNILDFYTVAGNAEYSPEQANNAIREILKNNNLSHDEIDAFEVNEAFGVIDVVFEREYGNSKKLNIFGGALAYGHPYGASGAVIAIHLLKALDIVNGRYGIAAIPAAGGLGVAMLVERINKCK